MTDSQHQLAARFISKCRGDTVYFLDTFWRFNLSQWAELPLKVLQGEIAAFVEKSNGPNSSFSRSLLRTVPDMIRDQVVLSPRNWNEDPDLLPCLNGLLNIADRSLGPLTADDCLMRTIGTMYDSRPHIATCPQTNHSLATALERLGFDRHLTGGRTYWLGLQLKSPDPSAVADLP